MPFAQTYSKNQSKGQAKISLLEISCFKSEKESDTVGYKTVIPPILTYASPAPTQNRALRIIHASDLFTKTVQMRLIGRGGAGPKHPLCL